MADFGANVTEAPQTQNFVSAQPAVETANVREPVALEGITNLFRSARSVISEQKEAAGNAFVGRFREQQLNLVQAVDQGIMSSTEARTTMRSNLITAIRDNPGLSKDILQANSSIVGAGGMGDIITDGTIEEQRQRKLDEALVQAGLVRPDSSEEDFVIARENFMIAQEAERRYKSEMETIAMERAKIGLNSERQAALESREERVATKYLVDTSPVLMSQFENRADELLGLLGTEGYDEATVLRLIDQEWASFERTLTPFLSQADQDTSDAFMKTYTNFRDMVIKQATGEYTDQQAEREKERIVAQAELSALDDPRIRRAVALSNLGLDQMLINTRPVQSAVADYMNSALDQNNVNPYSDPGKQEALNTYLKIISTDPAKLSEEQLTEQRGHVESIINGVSLYSSVLEGNPDKAIALVTNWMSTGEFFKVRQKYPELFDNNEAAMEAIQSNYGDEVWKMIQDEFTNNKVVSVEMQPREGAGPPSARISGISPTPDAVTFRATSGGMEFVAVDPQNRDASNRARELNKKLAPVINKNIKAFAHLEGTNNYRQFWETISQQYMFGQEVAGEGDGNIEGGAGEDTLSAPGNYRTAAMTTANQFGVDPNLFSAVVQQESGFDPNAVSPVGAFGLTQAMPDTAADPGFGVTPLTDVDNPQEQLRFGAEYLGAMMDKYNGDTVKALVAYNWGTGNADAWDGDMASLPAETRDYVNKIMQNSAYQPQDLSEYRINLSTGMNPLIDSLEGASHMTHDYAPERMNWVLTGPFQQMQEIFGGELTINDALAKEGTSRENNTPGSRHFHGDALDISIAGMSDEEKLRVVQAALEAGFQGFGFGNGILHVDMGNARSWAYGNDTFAGMPLSAVRDMVASGVMPAPEQHFRGTSEEREGQRFVTSEETLGGDLLEWDPDEGEATDLIEITGEAPTESPNPQTRSDAFVQQDGQGAGGQQTKRPTRKLSAKQKDDLRKAGVQAPEEAIVFESEAEMQAAIESGELASETVVIVGDQVVLAG